MDVNHCQSIDLLDSLADHCRKAARDALTEWHEIQAVEILGVQLETQHAFAEAAAAYRRVADLRRAALQESGHGLASALAAAAVASFRTGKRAAGRKLATEALGLHPAYPLPRRDLTLLRRQMRQKVAGQERPPTSRARRSNPKSRP
jgi:hypothetical protein